MEIIVKVTDAELKEMGVDSCGLQGAIIDHLEDGIYHFEFSGFNVEVINTDDAKRAIKTTKDKHLAIINNSYEG